MSSKPYFTSKYNFKLRGTGQSFDSFQEAKQLAYKAATEGIQNGFSQEWADQYVNGTPPGSILWWFEDMIRTYADFLNGHKTKEEAIRLFSEIEEEWNESDQILRSVQKFRQAANEAFVSKGIEFGSVEFTCPICGGNASSSRQNTPRNRAHAITIREGCKSCGYAAMN